MARFGSPATCRRDLGAHELVLWRATTAERWTSSRPTRRRRAVHRRADAGPNRARWPASLPLREAQTGTSRAARARWRRRGARAPVALAAERCYDRLPLTTVVEHKPFTLTAGRDDRAVSWSGRDLDEDEAGHYHQRLLRESGVRGAAAGAAARRRRLSRASTAASTPTARARSTRSCAPRGAGSSICGSSATASARSRTRRVGDASGSREYYEALASARYVVANDHFPTGSRAAPTRCASRPGTARRSSASASTSPTRRKQLPLPDAGRGRSTTGSTSSPPAAFSTPILRARLRDRGRDARDRLPADDVLARPRSRRAAPEVRRRLGIPEGKRIVLYAPTYRDHVFDQRGRYRLDLRLDLERLRARGRRRHGDPLPQAPLRRRLACRRSRDGFVRDVSRYPDGTELHARRRRAGHRLLVDDVRLREHRPPDALLHLRPRHATATRSAASTSTSWTRCRDRCCARPTSSPTRCADIECSSGRVRRTLRGFREKFCELDDGHAAAARRRPVFVE